ncbi:MAG: HRDC domain-containing protein [Planctomycetes bacterium]|nr:HRDC domain-containing protein [Planctomycetota bacterium]
MGYRNGGPQGAAGKRRLEVPQCRHPIAGGAGGGPLPHSRDFLRGIMMPLRFFQIPVRDDPFAVDELNLFLRSHRILKVDKHWVDQGMDSFWAFCIDYWDGARSTEKETAITNKGRVRVDYKEQLTPEQFEVFSKLRDWRKQVAQADAVPVYTVFTNEQLAQMVRIKAIDRAAIETILGVGDARLSKYGDPLVALLRNFFAIPTDGVS